MDHELRIEEELAETIHVARELKEGFAEFSRRNDEDHREMRISIDRKVSKSIFVPAIVLLVGIAVSTLAFQWENFKGTHNELMHAAEKDHKLQMKVFENIGTLRSGQTIIENKVDSIEDRQDEFAVEQDKIATDVDKIKRDLDRLHGPP